MKTKVLELLATKFEGVDSKILEGLAANLVKTKNITNDEEAETAVGGVTFSQVLQYHADKRAQEASDTARKNAINEYEKKYSLKDGKLVDDPAIAAAKAAAAAKKAAEEEAAKKAAAEEATKKAAEAAAAAAAKATEPTPPQGNEEWLKYVKELNEARQKEQEAYRQELDARKKELEASAATQKEMLETIKGLRSEFDGMKASRISATRKELLNKEIEHLTDAQRAPYSRISLDAMKDEEFDTFISEVKGNVAQIEKEKKAQEAAVSRPLGSGYVPSNGVATKEEIDELAKKMKL